MKECFKKISGYCRRNQKSIIAFLAVFAFLGLMMFLFSDSVLAQAASA